MTDKEKIREAVEKRYEYWREKEFNSHSIESEIRMSECQHLLLMLNSLKEEPISSVWRKPTETPKEGCAIVSVTDGCSFLEDDAFFLERYIPDWEGFIKEYNITRWAYKHDLMDKL